jgi:hypothetical protein
MERQLLITKDIVADAEPQTGNGLTRAPREVSTIAFPYVGIDEATTVAKALLDKGGVPCERDQLAAAMGLNPGGGSFIIKIAAAKLFGLIETPTGKFQLTSVGFDILEPDRIAAAKVTAFLSVPLYKRVYDEFKGKQLPPRPAGLENAFVQLGVAAKQKDKARHAFDKSARSAGFFPNAAEDRLVAPITGGVAPLASRERVDANVVLEPIPAMSATVSPVAVQVSDREPLHPFIEGLLKTLPPVGEDWKIQARIKWLQTASNIFSLIYEGDDGSAIIEISKGEL